MNNLSEILKLHKKWLNCEPDGEKADLSGANLSGADLRRADLSDANLRRANLSDANLSDANLRRANLSDANLRRADLSGADLSDANLRRADLSGADLSGADLSDADLSGAEGLLSVIEYLNEHFEKTDEGYIAYKTFGGEYTPPEKWVIQSGSIITENVNFNRTNSCGCGINVAPYEWVKDHYGYKGEIWKVLIKWEWLAGVCVPYMTAGKIRCERVQLLEVVNENTEDD